MEMVKFSQETLGNHQTVALLSPPIIRKGMYLTDGDQLYYVRGIKNDEVYLENCFTLTDHTRNLGIVSNWTEVNRTKL